MQTEVASSGPSSKTKKEETNFFWNSLSLQDVDPEESKHKNTNTNTIAKKIKKEEAGNLEERMQQEAQNVADKAATSFGFGLTMYATWIGITTLLVFNIITAFRFLGTIRSLVQSVRKLATDESFAILSLIFVIIQFCILTALFVWFQIVCKKCSRDIYNSALASCIQIRGALDKKATQNKLKKEKRFHRLKEEKMKKADKVKATKKSDLFWDSLVST